MCGIFAYSWEKNAVPLLIESLQSLEYRWYDSAGLLCINSKWEKFLQKAIWKVSMLSRTVEKSGNTKEYNTGIAHTRWATHGEVTIENTHPHYSSNERFYVVHNGIIENYIDLKKFLEKKWHSFYGDTDSEVVAKLIEYYFTWDIFDTVELITTKIVWAYSLAIIDTEKPDTIIWAKLWSPMIIGISDDGIILSSDINTVSKYASDFVSLDDREIVKIESGKYKVFSLWEVVKKDIEHVDDDYIVADKWDFETFTEKEIHDIPEVLKNVSQGRINFSEKSIKSETLDQLWEMDIKKIEIIGSGSSYFAWQVGTSWFKSLAWLEAEVRVSSEFLYDTFIPNSQTLYVFMSQSGETADVRESIKRVKQKWCHTFGIVNTVGSTISRMCDMWMYTHAWAEIGVASTKNVIAQLWVLLIMALDFGLKRDLQSSTARDIIDNFWKLPEVIAWMLKDQTQIEKIVEKYHNFNDFFYLWRGLLQWTAHESSLKLKELSYIHSEWYSTGELKHGPLALVWPNFPCVIIGTTNFLYEKTISNVKEIKARKAPVIGYIYESSKYIDVYDDVVFIPETHDVLAPITTLIPNWLFAIWVAKRLEKDIDKPQNLAKSVTVE